MEDVTDSSDWVVVEMREFDSKLRCPICHDYYRATMMLPTCLHSFCSLCIRRALLGERKCPVCMVVVSRDELIGNHLIDQLVSSFIAARPILLKALLERGRGEGEGEGEGLAQSQDSPKPSSQQLPSSSQSSTETRRKSQRISNEKIAHVGNDYDTAEQGDVQCPVCRARFIQEIIEEHVDQCLLRASTTDVPTRKLDSLVSGGAANRPKPLAPMKRPVYNLLKDAEIKKILRDLGLPTSGDRDTMIRRHSEFVLLYNAECDASSPKSLVRLRSELREMERAWSRKPAASLIDFGKEGNFEAKVAKYRRTNAGHYSDLVKQVKGYTPQTPIGKEE